MLLKRSKMHRGRTTLIKSLPIDAMLMDVGRARCEYVYCNSNWVRFLISTSYNYAVIVLNIKYKWHLFRHWQILFSGTVTCFEIWIVLDMEVHLCVILSHKSRNLLSRIRHRIAHTCICIIITHEFMHM